MQLLYMLEKEPQIVPSAAEVTPPSLTPRQESRVRAFKHLVNRTIGYQDKIDIGESWFFRVRNEKGKITDEILITQRTVDAMRRSAANMYNSFQAVDVMADAVSEEIGKLTTRRQENVEPKIIDPNTLWRRDADDQI